MNMLLGKTNSGQTGPSSIINSTAKFVNSPVINIPLTYFRHLKYGLNYLASPPRYKTIFVDPNNIIYRQVPRFKKYEIIRGSHIKNGEWDKRYTGKKYIRTNDLEDEIDRRCIALYTNYGFHESLKNYINNGFLWKDTKYYQRCIKLGASEESMQNEKQKVDYIYEDVKKKGYKTRQMISEKEGLNPPPEYDEIMVNIGRDGKLIHDDGRHRLSIAKILDLKKIPVRVFVRHEKWQRKRDKIRSVDNLDDSSEALAKYSQHPDIPDDWV